MCVLFFYESLCNNTNRIAPFLHELNNNFQLFFTEIICLKASFFCVQYMSLIWRQLQDFGGSRNNYPSTSNRFLQENPLPKWIVLSLGKLAYLKTLSAFPENLFQTSKNSFLGKFSLKEVRPTNAVPIPDISPFPKRIPVQFNCSKRIIVRVRSLKCIKNYCLSFFLTLIVRTQGDKTVQKLQRTPYRRAAIHTISFNKRLLKCLVFCLISIDLPLSYRMRLYICCYWDKQVC